VRDADAAKNQQLVGAGAAEYRVEGRVSGGRSRETPGDSRGPRTHLPTATMCES
jgi:hypothetical protein